MRLFTLYIGTNQSQAKNEIVRIVSEQFPSFTLIQGEGFFRGANETVWLVKIATEDCARIIGIAVNIRQVLDQDGVGIEFGGRYFRCTKDDCASALCKAWDETVSADETRRR